MADNVSITPGTGDVVAADQVSDGVLGTCKVQYVKIMDGTIDGTSKAAVGASGLKVDGSGVTQPISGSISVSNFPATQPISGSVSVSNFPASQAVTGTFFQATQPVSLAVAPTTTVVQPTGTNLHVVVDSAPSTTVTGTVTVSNFPATQPVSGTVTATGPLTDTQLRATPVPISGTVTSTPSGTQTISGTVTAVQATGTNLHVVVDSAPTTAVTGTFFQATQPVSGTVTSNQGTPATAVNRWPIQITDGTDLAQVSVGGALLVDGSAVTQPISGTVIANAGTGNFTVVQSTAANLNVTDTQGTSPWIDNVSQFGGSAVVTGVGVSGAGIPRITVATDSQMQLQPATLCVSTTAATGVAVTATLPAVAGQFHYITSIVITKYFTVANAASATPLLVTTTNIPGSLTFTFGQPLGTVGTTDVRIDNFGFPLKSSVVNTNTTIVAPATTGIIWRINVFYYAAA